MGRKQKPKPSFFKIMLPNFSDNLQIPPAFVHHFNGELTKKVILQISTGWICWIVKLKKYEEQLFLVGEGWGGFVEDNSLELGDLLVFRLFGASKFCVEMYDRTGCEKDNKGKVSEKRVQFKHDNRKLGMQRAFPGKIFDESVNPGKKVVSKKQVSEGYLNSNLPSEIRWPSTCQGKIELEAALQVKSGYPLFIKKLSLTSVKKRFLTLPESFVKTYLPKKSKSATILDSEGRTWPVSYNFAFRSNIGEGWNAVVLGNNLKEESVCAFELIDGQEELVLKLSVLNCMK